MCCQRLTDHRSGGTESHCAKARRHVDDFESTSARPRDCRSDATRIFALDDRIESRQRELRDRLSVALDGSPTPPHLVCRCRCRAAPSEDVNHELAGVGGDVDDPLEKRLGLRGVEHFDLREQGETCAGSESHLTDPTRVHQDEPDPHLEHR